MKDSFKLSYNNIFAILSILVVSVSLSTKWNIDFNWGKPLELSLLIPLGLVGLTNNPVLMANSGNQIIIPKNG